MQRPWGRRKPQDKVLKELSGGEERAGQQGDRGESREVEDGEGGRRRSW